MTSQQVAEASRTRRSGNTCDWAYETPRRLPDTVDPGPPRPAQDQFLIPSRFITKAVVIVAWLGFAPLGSAAASGVHYAQFAEQDGARILLQISFESGPACESFLRQQGSGDTLSMGARILTCSAKPTLRPLNFLATVLSSASGQLLEVEALTQRACEAGVSTIVRVLSGASASAPCLAKIREMEGSK